MYIFSGLEYMVTVWSASEVSNFCVSVEYDEKASVFMTKNKGRRNIDSKNGFISFIVLLYHRIEDIFRFIPLGHI